MSERGNKLNRLLDRYLGIPLTIPAFVYRRIDKLFFNRSAEKFINSSDYKVSQNNVYNIAIICLGAIGDLLLLSGLLLSIKTKHPNLSISLYTTKGNASAGELLTGVDTIHSFSLSEIAPFVISLRRNKYDIVIDSTQWARLGALISAFSGAKLTVGFKTDHQWRSLAYDIKVTHSKTLHEWKNFLALGKGVELTDSGELPLICYAGKALSDIFNLISSNLNILYLDLLDMESKQLKEFMVFHMFAAGSNATQRMWGDDKWTTLIEIYASKGYLILLSGSKTDRFYIDEFISKHISNKSISPNVLNIAGVLSLKELATLFKGAVAVVSVNTGPMHLASLIGTPTVGLNGPTDPLRWGPVGARSIALSPARAEDMLNLGFEKVSPKSNSSNINLSDVVEAIDLLVSKVDA